jgi:hypothetical protein
MPHVQVGLALGRAPYWRLPAALHLRCLSVLISDVLNCEGMRDVMARRVDLAADVQVCGGRAERGRGGQW